MCPASVLLDADLSDKAARVFGLLALRAFGRSTVALSREELATSLHCSESAAKRAISELAERGHIEIVRTHNHPNSYVLRSTVFSAAAAGAGTAAATPIPESKQSGLAQVAGDHAIASHAPVFAGSAKLIPTWRPG
jgi:hypothetical protein